MTPLKSALRTFPRTYTPWKPGFRPDPPMNWRVSNLDGRTLVSNSDAHSPSKLAREANLFGTELSFPAMSEALRTGEDFLGTIEFFPEEGKYHLDGHRKCNVCLTPPESLANDCLCPVCGKPLTLGVLHRVEALADRQEGRLPERRHPFFSLVPLVDILSNILGVGRPAKKLKQPTTKPLKPWDRSYTSSRTPPARNWKNPPSPCWPRRSPAHGPATSCYGAGLTASTGPWPCLTPRSGTGCLDSRLCSTFPSRKKKPAPEKKKSVENEPAIEQAGLFKAPQEIEEASPEPEEEISPEDALEPKELLSQAVHDQTPKERPAPRPFVLNAVQEKRGRARRLAPAYQGRARHGKNPDPDSPDRKTGGKLRGGARIHPGHHLHQSGGTGNGPSVGGNAGRKRRQGFRRHLSRVLP